MALPKTSVSMGIFDYCEVSSPQAQRELAELIRRDGKSYTAVGIQIYEFPHRAEGVRLESRLQELLGEDARDFVFTLTPEVDWHDEASLDIEYRKYQTPIKSGETQ
jgi:hypothetical protein